jgi:hypothetical protein
MYGLRFETTEPVVAPVPNRADIACFVGFIRQRSGDMPAAVCNWLREQGWLASCEPQTTPGVELLHRPVPVDSWEVFDRLFRWEHRDFDSNGQIGTTYLGAAVRSFFAQGGRKCYVIRVGDPWLYTARRDQEFAARQISKLIPGYPSIPLSLRERHEWEGIEHLHGLPDVSFLCLPDLADIVGLPQLPLDLPALQPVAAEQWVECAECVPPLSAERLLPRLHPPRCDSAGYRHWSKALLLAASFLAQHQREVQMVAALPLPAVGHAAAGTLWTEDDLLSFVLEQFRSSSLPGTAGQRPVSAFVQLAYPWVRTPGSLRLPGQLESPDAVLAGLLARNALVRGTFRSATHLHLADVYDLSPHVRREQMLQQHQSLGDATRYSVLEKVSLFGQTPAGLTLLSDVTTSVEDSYRPASVNRLMSSLLRAVRLLGEEMVFEPSSEWLWTQLRNSLNTLLTGLWQAGALRGATAAEAFRVRCDRSTMTQNDIDNGRVIAHVQFQATAPIEQIVVILRLHEGRTVTLQPGGAVEREGS